MEDELIQILEMLIALIAAIIAYWQKRQKDTAVNETRQIVAFFDPKDETVTSPPDQVPARSWKMNDETKRWVLAGHSPDDQASLLKQIAEAEEQKKMRYIISVPNAFYEIEYGLVKGGGKG